MPDGAVPDGVAFSFFFFFFFFFFFGEAFSAGAACSLGCWAFAPETVNAAAGTARLAANPTRKSTLRREITCDWICSLIANPLSAPVAAALLVMRHLTLGHPPELIISALARALLREDAGFHAYQMLEAGVRQFGEWGNTEPGRHILVAVARYLAAHSPTERGWLQTADIAARLSRGDQLHADAPPAH